MGKNLCSSHIQCDGNRRISRDIHGRLAVDATLCRGLLLRNPRCGNEASLMSPMPAPLHIRRLPAVSALYYEKARKGPKKHAVQLHGTCSFLLHFHSASDVSNILVAAKSSIAQCVSGIRFDVVWWAVPVFLQAM